MATIATAEVDVIANTRGFVSQLRRDLRRQLSGLGGQFGRNFGNQFTSEMRRGMGQRIASALTAASPAVDRVGRQSGLRFGLAFVGAASSALVRAATRPFRNFGQIIRQSILGFRSDLGLGQRIASALTVASPAVDRVGRQSGRRFGLAFVRAAAVPFRAFGQIIGQSVVLPLLGFREIIQEIPSDLGQQLFIWLSIFGVLNAIAPLAAGLPAVFGLITAAIVTMRVAFSGFGAVLSALRTGDLEAVRTAMVDLAPAARRVVEDMIVFRRSLEGITRAAQEALFARIGDQFQRMADTLAGPLREGLTASSSGLGAIVAQILEFAAAARTAEVVREIFTALGRSFEIAAAGFGPFLRGLREAASALLPQMERAVVVITAAFERWGTALEDAAGTGALAAAFDGAVESMLFLAGLLQSTLALLSAVFDAAAASGAGFGILIGELLDMGTAIARSEEGAASLQAIFRGLADLIVGLSTAVGGLISGLGIIAPLAGELALIAGPALAGVLIAIAQAIASLGPGLIAVFQGLAAGIETIAPVMEIVGQALGAALSALSPLAEFLGEFVAEGLSVIAELLLVVAEAVAPLVSALVQELRPALQLASQFISRLVEALGPILQAVAGRLTQALGRLVPLFLDFAQAAGDAWLEVMTGLLPALIPLVDVLLTLVENLLPIWLEIQLSLITALGQFAPIVAMLAQEVLPLLAELVIVLVEEFGALALELVQELMPILPELAALFAEIAVDILPVFIEAMRLLLPTFVDLVPLIAEFLRVFAFIVVIFARAIRGVIELASAFREFLSPSIEAILVLFLRLQFFMTILRILLSEFRDRIMGFFGNLREAFEDFVALMQSLPERIRQALARIPEIVRQALAPVTEAIASIGSSIASLNPFADGGIVTSPTAALIGEAGPEVVIPLTRPARAAQLAQQSGLLDILGAAGALPSGGGVSGRPIEIHVHTQSVDPERVAERAVRQLTTLATVR